MPTTASKENCSAPGPNVEITNVRLLCRHLGYFTDLQITTSERRSVLVM
jgi:hypothetical protein